MAIETLLHQAPLLLFKNAQKSPSLAMSVHWGHFIMVTGGGVGEGIGGLAEEGTAEVVEVSSEDKEKAFGLHTQHKMEINLKI